MSLNEFNKLVTALHGVITMNITKRQQIVKKVKFAMFACLAAALAVASPALAFAAEEETATTTTQAVEFTQNVAGTMTVSMDGATTSAVSLPTTGDPLFWALVALMLVSIVSAAVVYSRKKATCAPLGNHARNKGNGALLFMLATLVLAGGVATGALTANASITPTASSAKSEIKIDADGNVLENSLVVNNGRSKNVTVETLSAPEKMSDWSASLEGKTIEANKEITSDWDTSQVSKELVNEIALNGGKMELPFVCDLTFESEITVDTSDVIYKSAQYTPTVTAEKELSEGVDYKVVYGENVDAGKGTVSIAGIGDLVADATFNFNILQKEVTVSNITAESKVYDQTTDATFKTDTATLTGKIEGDDLGVEAKGTFDTKDVAENKDVAVSKFTLTGEDAPNYYVAKTGNQESSSANITQKRVTVSGITASNKTYDSGTGATLDTTKVSIDTVFSGDVVSLKNVVGNFEDKNVGETKKVKLSDLELEGQDAPNYYIEANSSSDDAETECYVANVAPLNEEPTANITPASVKVSGVTAEPKTYDATTNVTLVTNNPTFEGKFEVDNLGVEAEGAFKDKHAGDVKEVEIKKFTLTGDDASNYEVKKAESQETTSARITPKTVDVVWDTAGTVSYTYNGKNHAPSARVVGTMNDEAVSPVFSLKNGEVDLSANPTDASNEYTSTVSSLVKANEETQASDYQLPGDGCTKPFEIGPCSITPALIKVAAAPIYNGSEQTQSISNVTLTLEDGTVLTPVATTDYTIETGTDKGTNAQSYILKIDGTGNYKDTASVGWKIEPRSIDTDGLKVVVEELTYNKQEQTTTPKNVTLTLEDGTTVLTLNTGDYDVSGTTKGTNVTEEGYNLTLTGKGNFKDSRDAKWNLKPLDISSAKVEVSTNSEGGVWTGTTIKATVTSVQLESLGLSFSQGVDWEIGIKDGKSSVTEAIDSGTYYVYCAAKSLNLTGVATGSWLISGYTIIYHGNGGTNADGAETYSQHCEVGVASKFINNSFTQSGKKFGFWTLGSETSGAVTASTTTYVNEHSFTNLTSNGGRVHVYAHWLDESTGNYWMAANGAANPDASSSIIKTQTQIDASKTNQTFWNTLMNNNSRLYTIWQYDEVTNYTNRYAEFRIIQVGQHDSDGSTVTFMSSHELPTFKKVLSNKTIDGGWGSTYLKGQMTSYVEKGLSSISPKAVNKVSAYGTGSNINNWGTTTYSEKFWLISMSELSGTSSTDGSSSSGTVIKTKSEGSQYSFFKGGGGILQFLKTRSGTDAHMWTRTPNLRFNTATDHDWVYYNRYKDIFAPTWGNVDPFGINPCFCF